MMTAICRTLCCYTLSSILKNGIIDALLGVEAYFLVIRIQLISSYSRMHILWYSRAY